MKKSRSIFLLLTLAFLAVLVTFFVLRSTVRPTLVVVARQDLSAGTLLTADLLEVKTSPRGGVPAGSFTTIADLTGKTLAVERVAGDPITSYVVGDESSASGIPAMLEPGTVAIAVKVDQATGLAGVLRPGQKVTVIGIIDPSVIKQGQLGYYSAPAPDLAATASAETGGVGPTPTPAPTATTQPPISPAARVTITGLKVLVVPQSFRYQEVTSSESDTSSSPFLPARTTSQAQNSNVVLLQASIKPVEVAPGVFSSPAEVLALLNDTATIHLVLEPSSGVTGDVNSEGVDLAKLYEALTGYKLVP